KWGDTPTVEVPNLIGMKKKDLQTQLVDLKLDISGDGEKVIKQSPEAGAKVKEGSKIRIYFGN
ncbi:PASTA domain-containing protein, partial [Acinetobacter baumannii]